MNPDILKEEQQRQYNYTRKLSVDCIHNWLLNVTWFINVKYQNQMFVNMYCMYNIEHKVICINHWYRFGGKSICTKELLNRTTKKQMEMGDIFYLTG